MGQCTQNVNHLKALQDYEQVEEKAAVLLLIKLLNKIAFNFEEQKNMVDGLLSVNENFHNYSQGNTHTTELNHIQMPSISQETNPSP